MKKTINKNKKQRRRSYKKNKKQRRRSYKKNKKMGKVTFWMLKRNNQNKFLIQMKRKEGLKS